MAAYEPSILDLMQEAGREPPRVRLPAAVAEGGDDGDGAAVGRTGRYEVLGLLAEGGVGEILQGRDLDLGRDVALKVLRAKHRANPELVQRLLDEAQIGGQLQHPGIVPVYEIGVDEAQRPYVAMKLVKGKTLAATLAERSRPEKGRRRFLRLFAKLAEAVAYAHARGVVHRDLKPANVMVGTFGEVQVLDWGFAKVLRRGGLADEHRRDTRDADVTRIMTVRSQGEGSVAGSVMGTPAYMPPEQALGEIDHLDERCDVFALGAVLCEILTGAPPYVGEREEILTLAAQARLDDANARLDAGGADPALVALCRACLEPLRADRPRDAGVVAERVHDHLSAVEERARKARLAAAEARAAAEKAEAEADRQRRARRQGLVVGASLLALLVAAVGGAWAVRADARTQAARRTDAVVAALQDAEQLRGEARLAEAEAAAERAALLGQEGNVAESLRRRAADLLSSLERERAQADADAAQREKDEAMVHRLQEIEAQPENGQTADALGAREDGQLAEAFREYGLDVESLSAADAGAAIRASAIHADLLRGVAYWIERRRLRLSAKDDDWAHLAAVADAADPDPWSVEFRRAAFARDADAIRAAAQDDEALAERPERAVDMAKWLAGVGEPERALHLLEQALVRRPDDAFGHRLAATLAAKLSRPAIVRRHQLAHVALGPETAERCGSLAGTLHAAGEYDEGLGWAERALRLDPESLRVVGTVVSLHRDRGTLDEAVARWEAELAETPDAPQLTALLGISASWRGDVPGARRHLEHLLELRPDSARARAWLAALRGYDAPEDAYALLAEAERQEPGRWVSSLGSMMGATRRGKKLTHAEAVARFEKLLPNATKAQRYSFLLAYANTRPSGFDAANELAACREAAELRPESAWPYLYESVLLRLFTRDAAGAAAAGARAVALDPWSEFTHHEHGMAAWEAGRTEEALEAFRAATARNAALGQAHHAWIWALAYEGRADEAVAYYERRIREHPTVNDRVCLGIALVRDGRPEAAIEVLETVWREDPNQVGATTWLGTAYFQAGRDADAVAALEDALPRRRSARAPSTPFLLGDVHLRGGRFEKARDVFLEGIRRGGPSAAYFQRHAAYAAALTMEPDEARAWCEKHFPPPGGPYTASHIEMGIGEACYARADLEGTIHHLGAAVQRFPAYPVPRQYLGRAHIVRGDAEAAWDVLPDEGKLRISGLLSPIAWEKGDFEEKACKENPAADLVPSTQGGIDSQADLDDRVKESRDAAEHLRCTARWRRRLARLEEHADAIRQGTYEPDSTRAALDAAEWARCKGAHAVAVAYFQQAFEGYVEEFDDARLRIRYRAARAAARAGEAAGIVSEERKALHVQARGWLEEELPYWRSRLDERPPRGRIHVSIVEPELWHWKYHLDLASVRDADALAKLPDDEREAWEAFWQEVDAVLGTAR